MSDAKTERGPDSPANIFVSYSRKDASFVDRLEAGLFARGFSPKIDREDIYAFEDWWRRIEELIVKADTIVFVLSPDAVSSEICKKEVEFAASLKKRFAPIVFRPVDPASTPDELARLNFIFFDDEARFDESADRLAQALSTDIDWIRKHHTEFGESARRWSLAGRPGPKGLLLRPPVLEEAERWIASRPPDAPAPTEATQAFIVESRRAETRRQRLTAAAAVVFLGVAAAVGFAWYRAGEGLIDAREQSLQTQGEIIASAIAASATVDTKAITIAPEKLLKLAPGESYSVTDGSRKSLEFSINPERVGPLLRRLLSPTRTRARIYDRDGYLLLDSRSGRSNILRADLPSTGAPTPNPGSAEGASLFEEARNLVRRWTRRPELPLYEDIGMGNGKSYPEVGGALAGAPQQPVVRANAQGETIISVAVPVQRYRSVRGALLLSTLGGDIDAIIAAERWGIIRIFLIYFGLAVLVAIFLFRLL